MKHHALILKGKPPARIGWTIWGWKAFCECGWEQTDNYGLWGTSKQAGKAYHKHKYEDQE